MVVEEEISQSPLSCIACNVARLEFEPVVFPASSICFAIAFGCCSSLTPSLMESKVTCIASVARHRSLGVVICFCDACESIRFAQLPLILVLLLPVLTATCGVRGSRGNEDESAATGNACVTVGVVEGYSMAGEQRLLVSAAGDDRPPTLVKLSSSPLPPLLMVSVVTLALFFLAMAAFAASCSLWSLNFFFRVLYLRFAVSRKFFSCE
mmetsp:Transcript_22554/g.27829  ORF Transcript_22554/g.27829 Transcript_22554/m.27829 type:complete len:209 (-) Transcript_22554:2760-3386(-)